MERAHHSSILTRCFTALGQFLVSHQWEVKKFVQRAFPENLTWAWPSRNWYPGSLDTGAESLTLGHKAIRWWLRSESFTRLMLVLIVSALNIFNMLFLSRLGGISWRLFSNINLRSPGDRYFVWIRAMRLKINKKKISINSGTVWGYDVTCRGAKKIWIMPYTLFLKKKCRQMEKKA